MPSCGNEALLTCVQGSCGQPSVCSLPVQPGPCGRGEHAPGHAPGTVFLEQYPGDEQVCAFTFPTSPVTRGIFPATYNARALDHVREKLHSKEELKNCV